MLEFKFPNLSTNIKVKPVLQIIIQAIHNREVLSLVYDGKIRTVEPHRVGLSTARHNVLSAYQTNPSTIYDAGRTNWRLFDLAKITALKPTGLSFDNPRDGYKKQDKLMTKTYAEL